MPGARSRAFHETSCTPADRDCWTGSAARRPVTSRTLRSTRCRPGDSSKRKAERRPRPAEVRRGRSQTDGLSVVRHRNGGRRAAPQSVQCARRKGVPAHGQPVDERARKALSSSHDAPSFWLVSITATLPLFTMSNAANSVRPRAAKDEWFSVPRPHVDPESTAPCPGTLMNRKRFVPTTQPEAVPDGRSGLESGMEPVVVERGERPVGGRPDRGTAPPVAPAAGDQARSAQGDRRSRSTSDWARTPHRSDSTCSTPLSLRIVDTGAERPRVQTVAADFRAEMSSCELRIPPTRPWLNAEPCLLPGPLLTNTPVPEVPA